MLGVGILTKGALPVLSAEFHPYFPGYSRATYPVVLPDVSIFPIRKRSRKDPKEIAPLKGQNEFFDIFSLINQLASILDVLELDLSNIFMFTDAVKIMSQRYLWKAL